MLGKSIIRHVLSNQQPLISIAAVPNQIGEPPMPQLPNSPRLLLPHPKYKISHITQLSSVYTQNPNEPNESKSKELYRKLFGVRPSQVGELLHRNPSTVVEAALVDEIGGLLAALGDDEVWAEVVGGGLEVREGELGEGRDSCSSGRYRVKSNGRWVGLGLELGLLLLFFWVRLCQKGRLTATHDSIFVLWAKLGVRGVEILVFREMGLFSFVSFLFQSLYNLVVGFSFSLSSSLFLLLVCWVYIYIRT